MPTLEEFDAYVVQLDNHDWTFEYSDDGNVWRRGKDQERALLDQANKQPVLMSAYKAYINYTFTHPDRPWPERRTTRTKRITELRQQIQIAMTNKLLLNAT